MTLKLRKFLLFLLSSFLIEKDYKIDLSKYEENFHQIIDSLILLAFGKEVYELLAFYFYERHNPDGSQNGLIIEETGEELFIKDPMELWELIVKVNPKIFDGKR